MAQRYSIAWWNLENLFDSVNSPRRTEKLRRAIGSDLAGWTTDVRDRKIRQLADVIASLDDGAGPDLLGICEVENEFVVERLRHRLAMLLPARNYRVAYADTIDRRGIDVAFVYESAKLEVPDGEVFQHVVMRRTATRDILQVNFKTKPAGRTWTVFANHWPSRSGGRYESEGYRQIAGETLAYFHQRASEVHGASTPVLVMGDFNDEPFDSSLVRYALGTSQRSKVTRATSPRLLNLMWPLLGDAKGTFYFNNWANMLDQFLVNRHMLVEGSPIRVNGDSVAIEDRHPGLRSDGRYPQPLRFGGMGKPVVIHGFSDHFPISVEVNEAD